MNSAIILAVAFLGGGALGAIFFGGLWWTVGQGLASSRPALWFCASLLLRLGIVLPGFYFVAGGHAERLVACLLGFLMARLIVTRLTRASGGKQAHLANEAHHAP